MPKQTSLEIEVDSDAYFRLAGSSSEYISFTTHM